MLDLIIRDAGMNNCMIKQYYSFASLVSNYIPKPMKRTNSLVTVFLSAILFTVLFHKQSLGLNLFIFEALFFLWLILKGQYKFKGLYPLTIGLGFIISSAFTVINHSAYTFVIHFLIFFAFIGVLAYPYAKSLISSMGLSFTSLYQAQERFIRDMAASKIKGKSLGRYLLRLAIYIIPLIIIIVFIAIYRNSNPVFNDLLCDIALFFNVNLMAIFIGVDGTIILTLLLGVILSSFMIIRVREKMIADHDSKASILLTKPEKMVDGSVLSNALANEYRSGIFLFLILNVILMVLNVIDIHWVWFGFEWEGQYLKQFVHEGTYLLIFSILLSMALVLFYFRGSLNFYRKNKVLKYLSIFWLAQNALLAISVAVRNYWYIEYFSLAYKRIGVFIFLLMVIYGLYSILLKVQHRRSAFFLLKTNIFAVLMILLISSFVNWDNVIAKYNFNHAEESFLHLDFMARLSDKSLPYLDKSIMELKEIERIQQEKFPFTESYMDSETYIHTIKKRKLAFKDRWESTSFLSWNLTEYLAYKKMFSSEQ